MNLPILDPRPTRIVNCGTCTDCCHDDAIFLHPECGDDESQYQTTIYEGRLILKHQENGDCIYLDRDKGCTIWERRPVICREMDCVELVKVLGKPRAKAMGLEKMVYAASRRNRHGHGTRSP